MPPHPLSDHCDEKNGAMNVPVAPLTRLVTRISTGAGKPETVCAGGMPPGSTIERQSGLALNRQPRSD